MSAEQPAAQRKPVKQALADHAPWKPPAYALADVSAIQALAAGTADKLQQARALRLIIEGLAGTYDLSYRPGPEGDRDTTFAEGRRFVGLQLVKLTKLNISKLRRDHVDT